MFKGVRHTKFSVVKVLLLNSIQYITGEHPELVYVMKQWIQEGEPNLKQRPLENSSEIWICVTCQELKLLNAGLPFHHEEPSPPPLHC